MLMSPDSSSKSTIIRCIQVPELSQSPSSSTSQSPSQYLIKQEHQLFQRPQLLNNSVNSTSVLCNRPLTPEYTAKYPVMDTTVASSMKGEPALNIGWFLNKYLLYNNLHPLTQLRDVE